MDVADGQSGAGWVLLHGTSCSPWEATAASATPFYLHEVYRLSDPLCTTRITMPVLWDKKVRTKSYFLCLCVPLCRCLCVSVCLCVYVMPSCLWMRGRASVGELTSSPWGAITLQLNVIVSNDSWAIVKMFAKAFRSLGTAPESVGLGLVPPGREEELDAVHQQWYSSLLNGVYRAVRSGVPSALG